MDNNDNINILSIPKGKKLILEKININDFPEYKKRLKKHFEEPSNYFNDDLGNKKIRIGKLHQSGNTFLTKKLLTKKHRGSMSLTNYDISTICEKVDKFDKKFTKLKKRYINDYEIEEIFNKFKKHKKDSNINLTAQNTFINSTPNSRESTNTKNNINKIMEELNTIKEKINDKNISNEDKCELHNKYIQLLKDSNELIRKGKNILSQSNKLFNELNKEETINKYNEFESIQNKILLDREDNIIQSLSNATKNKGSYKLNRFVTYRHEGLKYFGFSTLEFSCNKDIILYGIFLCGKYLSSNKIKQKDYSEVSLDERSFYSINVKIFDLKLKSMLLNENKKLYDIIDANNPVINIYFDNGIKINKEEKYVIVVENLENDKFGDIWVGNVHKILIMNKIQKIKCNNTGFEFNFNLSNEFNSDLNEFKQGIIEGLLYGN